MSSGRYGSVLPTWLYEAANSECHEPTLTPTDNTSSRIARTQP